jgi:hypothetical protein
VDWDHRLPSSNLILRVYGYYSEDTLEAGYEAFDDRFEQIAERDKYPEFDVPDFDGLAADEAYEIELSPDGKIGRCRLTSAWRRTVATVDWLTSQIPARSKFQIIAFNTKAWPVVAGSAGRWLDGSDAKSLSEAVVSLRRTVPADGTSLENAFAQMNTLNPAPDNVFIITDGLPTQGATPPAIRKTIDGDGRYTNDFFEVRNGKKLSDVTTGTITISGRLISIRQKNTMKYVIRGWLELPDMTVLKVAGPWYDSQEIPERVFTDFGPDSRFILTAKWVRKK